MKDLDIQLVESANENFKPCNITIKIGNETAAAFLYALFNHAYVNDVYGLNPIGDGIRKLLINHGLDQDLADKIFLECNRELTEKFKERKK